jgi:ribosomal protein S17E
MGIITEDINHDNKNIEEMALISKKEVENQIHIKDFLRE